jgi:hypothetical protein
MNRSKDHFPAARSIIYLKIGESPAFTKQNRAKDLHIVEIFPFPRVITPANIWFCLVNAAYPSLFIRLEEKRAFVNGFPGIRVCPPVPADELTKPIPCHQGAIDRLTAFRGGSNMDEDIGPSFIVPSQEIRVLRPLRTAIQCTTHSTLFTWIPGCPCHIHTPFSTSLHISAPGQVRQCHPT